MTFWSKIAQESLKMFFGDSLGPKDDLYSLLGHFWHFPRQNRTYNPEVTWAGNFLVLFLKNCRFSRRDYSPFSGTYFWILKLKFNTNNFTHIVFYLFFRKLCLGMRPIQKHRIITENYRFFLIELCPFIKEWVNVQIRWIFWYISTVITPPKKNNNNNRKKYIKNYWVFIF